MNCFSAELFLLNIEKFISRHQDAAKIEEVERETKESTTSIPKLEEEVVKLTQKLAEEENTLEEIRENAKGEVEQYRVQLDAVRVELEPWEKQIIECQGKIGTASSESKLFNEKRLLKEEEKLATQEQGVRQRVNEIRTSLDSEKSQGVVLQAVMKAKELKSIDGIYGRLGDLGAIDAKFDVAISTACGGLDYIVVETTTAAQACVELLRSKGLGVATFLILEKQKDLIQAMNQRVQTPEGVPRLFDLVKVRDEKLRVAFFYALGNTVVAKDLDQGTKIAYGPDRQFARVVTLDGAMFEKSGTMSGGGGKPRGGRMGTKIRDASGSGEALQAAESELTRLTEQLAVIRERIGVAVSQYQAAGKAVGKLELEIAKTRMEVRSSTLEGISENNFLDLIYCFVLCSVLKCSEHFFQISFVPMLKTSFSFIVSSIFYMSRYS
ncbi:hypothetical protein Mapa_012721 [Marchantia paleacea]|nr:hypothetical protein Mapa_012721 [Marchantia paleacea]